MARALSLQLRGNFLSLELVRKGINALGWAALAACIVLAALTGEICRDIYFELSKDPVTATNTDTSTEAVATAPKQSLASYSIIEQRNLFAAAKDAQVETKKTNLKLRLVGTSIPDRSAPFAIIENKANQQQDVFEINEKIFKQAKLVEVLQDSVRIDNKGEIETLFLEEGKTGGSTPTSSGEDMQISEAELEGALANLPQLLSQARAVPYFRNGQSIGMRIFAIKKGSMYEKLGLQNGDIILAVNETSLSDPAQALRIWEQLKQERSVNVKIERSGTSKDLSYTIR